MKISRSWLQEYFERELPNVHDLAQALTFHAFEIESIGKPNNSETWDILDIKVTPNRGHDCLSHRGIAKEVSAILNIPMKSDPLREPMSGLTNSRYVEVSIENSSFCSRYIAGYIKGVKVGPSPAWLKERLESIGQKSINNIVDATNFVMFNLGQPLHAFDAGKMGNRPARGKNGFKIQVRNARKGEQIITLDDKQYALADTMLVVADQYTDISVGIAGVKGGKAAAVDASTTDIIIESANFDGVSVRKTAQALKLRTDASERFQQAISPEIAAHAMRAAVDTILKIAGGVLVGFADEYPAPQKMKTVSVSVAKVNAILGTSLAADDIADALKRLALPFEKQGSKFSVTPPFERLDLLTAGDLSEEVGRIVGYDKVPTMELSPLYKKPDINPNFYAAEHAREDLVSKGYSEVFTSVFVDKGEREVLNKVGGERPFLRTNLLEGLTIPLIQNIHNRDLLGLKKIKLFEIGPVWKDGEESTNIYSVEGETVEGFGISGTQSVEMSLEEYRQKNPIDEHQEKYQPLPFAKLDRYHPFSKYPFIVRDIALWVSSGTKPEQVLDIIRAQAGELLVRSALFDTYEKGAKLSLAFRLVFQSFDGTLTDEEVNVCMENICAALRGQRWEVR